MGLCTTNLRGATARGNPEVWTCGEGSRQPRAAATSGGRPTAALAHGWSAQEEKEEKKEARNKTDFETVRNLSARSHHGGFDSITVY